MIKHPNINRALKKQKKYRVPVLENTIHAQIAQYLNLVIKRPSRWHTVEVSNQASGRAAMFRQIALKRKGVVTGWPDICVYHTVRWPGYDITSTDLIFLEVKIPGGQLTEKQAALHKELKEDGHEVHVVHSVDEVKTILEHLGVI